MDENIYYSMREKIENKIKNGEQLENNITFYELIKKLNNEKILNFLRKTQNSKEYIKNDYDFKFLEQKHNENESITKYVFINKIRICRLKKKIEN
jgi:hypothetical protein